MGKKLPKTMDALQPAAAAEHVADVNESALGYLHDGASARRCFWQCIATGACAACT